MLFLFVRVHRVVARLGGPRTLHFVSGESVSATGWNLKCTGLRIAQVMRRPGTSAPGFFMVSPIENQNSDDMTGSMSFVRLLAKVQIHCSFPWFSPFPGLRFSAPPLKVVYSVTPVCIQLPRGVFSYQTSYLSYLSTLEGGANPRVIQMS